MKPTNMALGDNGFLLPREDRLRMQELLEAELDLLYAIVKSGEANSLDLERFVTVDEQVQQLERINACEFDVARFAIEYFSDDANPENDENLIPKGVNYANMSKFHKEFSAMLSNIALGKADSNIAWACPRSHAKTAYGSNIFPVHQGVYKHRTFIVVISETVTVAGAFIQWGNRQFKFNRKLIDDFGTLLFERPALNELDNKEEYVTQNGVKVMARGAGGQMRGMRYGNTRPQLMIFDDLEGEEDVNTKEQRAKMRNWFNEEALPAMDKVKGMALYVGTILCYDSLLDIVIRKDRRFKSKRYKAVESFASNTELWEEWRRIYLADDEQAQENARAFYEANEEAMLEGTKLLWGEYWTYYDFMIRLTNMGVKSFTQEYQNEPTDEERQIFKLDRFFFFDENEVFDHERYEFYCGIDFAMGKEKGDYSAIVTIAKSKATDVCYVIDVFNKRVHPREFLEVIIDKVRRFQYTNIAVETQMAQEFFADTLSERLNELGYPAHSRLVSVKQRTRKELRIEAMSPDTENGRIRFMRSHTGLLEQYEKYPMVDFDDMVDATEMAYSIATKINNGSIEGFGNYYDKVGGTTTERRQDRLSAFNRRFRRR
ncbi:phage terminase large subunit [Macrococcus capreoli]|uniref:phage terminase large subunit n=1 Tax=Macrococcus capreoli TaxID=2982690 RepID=UPI0021D59164|nr:phage terminase large subunit [Macrococcus sp. TMW 2.2395]MCU7556543.1 phage terminase large subunit [Macrococcus sp. TMW 2.2395]